MELDAEQVAKVMADGRHGKGGQRQRKPTESFDDAVKRLVAQGCSAGDIKVIYPHRSDREIEEAVAYAQHAS